MKHSVQTKKITLMLAFMFTVTWSGAVGTTANDGPSPIVIKEATVQGIPRTSSIEAIINGHQLTVTFSENLGNVQVEVTTATGGTVDLTDLWTPNSYIAYIPNTGDYVVTITLGNGDEYYGEFEVTD
jgi:hypothetical protein